MFIGHAQNSEGNRWRPTDLFHSTKQNSDLWGWYHGGISFQIALGKWLGQTNFWNEKYNSFNQLMTMILIYENISVKTN